LPTIYKKSRVQNHSIEILPSNGHNRGPSEYFCASEQFQRDAWIIFHPRNKRKMRFRTITWRKTSGSVPSRCRNARWVSRCAVMLAGGTFTRTLNIWHLRHSPVEVHASKCVTCDQRRRFRANSSKIGLGMGLLSPSECAVGVETWCDARWWDIYTDSEHLAFAELALASESLAILIGYG
jgi:hypothetical protein